MDYEEYEKECKEIKEENKIFLDMFLTQTSQLKTACTS